MTQVKKSSFVVYGDRIYNKIKKKNWSEIARLDKREIPDSKPKINAMEY